jgi:ribosome-associated toxin RatA of RatAB toxin-antitoxin module
MDRKAEDVKTVSRLSVSTRMRASADRVFTLLTDVEARVGQVAAYKKVEVTDRTADGFMARFHEHYGGRDVVILSRFRFERPRWITYEHVEGPYGTNRGRYEIVPSGDETLVTQTHETEQDISEGSDLREQWMSMIQQKLDAVQKEAEGTPPAAAGV